MSLTFQPVTSPEGVKELSSLAEEIWREHFTPILPEGQVDYMLEKFQSVPAMTKQLREEGYRYFLIQKDGQSIGYTGVRPENGRLFLSKLYLKKEERGKGYAGEAFRFLEDICRKEGLSSIWLTVNRHNDGPIAVYRKKGFRVIREQAADIGGGYVMDDYIMEKTIEGAM